SEMVAWAAMIVESSSNYCMGSTAQQTFGGVPVLARVEWHPPEPSHDSIHRGVTLYEPDHGRAATAGAGGRWGESRTNTPPSCRKPGRAAICGVPPIVAQYAAEAFVASDR